MLQAGMSQRAVTGVGLRHPHYEAALSCSADLDFVEVHTENFFAEGGASLAVLEQARERYDLSFHCTALGLGSAAGISREAVARLARLVERFDPMLVSDHLCFCWVNLGGRRRHAGDLLPLSYTAATLDVLADNVDSVQQAIGRPLLIENITSYTGGREPQWPETVFLHQLVERTGCRLLVDINNLLVNAHNEAYDSPIDYATDWLDEIPAAAVGEIHLAGYTDTPAGSIAIDDHAAPVSDAGWQVYRHAVQRFGNVPTLVEWDNRLPAWPELVAESIRARQVADSLLRQGA